MKEILQNVYSAKEVYRKNQIAFYNTFRSRHPNIMDIEMRNVVNDLESELKYLLATCVIYRTGRIKVTSCGWSNTEDAFIEQKPYIHFYHSSNDDIKFIVESHSIDSNGDLRIKRSKDESDKPTLLLELSALKKVPKQIDQVRFDIFMKYLREVMAYKDRLLFYDNRCGSYFDLNQEKPLVGSKLLPFANESMLVYLKSRKFSILKRKSTKSSSYQDNTEIMELLDYCGSESHGNTGPYTRRLQSLLGDVIENYDDFIDKIHKAEIEKRKSIEVCNVFINGMKQYTIPFKVLRKLL